jgi:hypothetical protein
MEKYSDVETRGNGLWQWPVYPTVDSWLWVDTDKRKKLAFETLVDLGTDRGGHFWRTYLAAQYRPKSNMEFVIGTDYRRDFGATRWLTNEDLDGDEEDESIFADLDQDRISLILTASLMLTRNLSWQISGQGLISTLDYGNHRRHTGGDSYSYDGVDPANYEEENGTFSALNSMMLVRWEYMPGSTIYFVWTRSRGEFDDAAKELHLKNEFDRFFSRGAENVWLVKMSYWWNI